MISAQNCINNNNKVKNKIKICKLMWNYSQSVQETKKM